MHKRTSLKSLPFLIKSLPSLPPVNIKRWKKIINMRQTNVRKWKKFMLKLILRSVYIDNFLRKDSYIYSNININFNMNFFHFLTFVCLILIIFFSALNIHWRQWWQRFDQEWKRFQRCTCVHSVTYILFHAY